MAKRLTHDEFVINANNIHNNEYTYPLNDYKNRRGFVTIECSKHGQYKQRVKDHLNGSKCPKCARINTAFKNTYSYKEYEILANEVHNNTYIYFQDYINSSQKIKIECRKHGIFKQDPSIHLQKQGCPKCKNDLISKRCKDTVETFISKANKIHNYKYDYSQTKYIASQIKICIICPKHGKFYQRPNDHLMKHGCPICNNSLGENTILNILKEYNIEYIIQKRFKLCKNKKSLPFDFYLPKYNILIEYDGIQHFIPVNYFSGINGFNKLKINDNIKTKFAYDNNIKLLRINYKQITDIRHIILKELNIIDNSINNI